MSLHSCLNGFGATSVAAATLFLFGCSSSSSPAKANDAGMNPADVVTTPAEGGADAGTPPDTTPAACPVVVSAANCDKSMRPIVFVHGTYSSGTDIAHMAALFGSNGFCQDRFYAIDYNSVTTSVMIGTGGIDHPAQDCTGTNTPTGCGIIDRMIDKVLADPKNVDASGKPFTQVDLAGHSQGTFHCGTYLGLHAAKVAHYINFSGVPAVGDVQTLSLSSLRDLNIAGFPPPHHATGTANCAFNASEDGGITPATDDGGVSEGGAGDAGGCNVKQITLIHQDHFAVAASKDSFVQVWRYLTGKDPKYTDIQCGDDPVTIEGVAETFADNVPVNGMLEIRALGTIPRDTSAPAMMPMSDATGHFGPIQLKRGVPYSFTGHDKNGKLVGWQYYTPFLRDNHLLRLLSPSKGDGSPVGDLVAMQSTDHAVTSSTSSVVIARWAQGGFRQDLGASLKVNGTEVLTSDNSGLAAAMSMQLQGGVAAIFLEDAKKNGMTDLSLAYSTTFIAFTDVFIDATKPAWVDLNFTAGSEDPATVNVPFALDNFPSDQGLIEIMFQ